MIDSCIKKFIEKYSLQNKTIIVGFSGGYDSTCLLYSLNNLKKEYNLELVGVHYNHNWRGKTAEEEQKNCNKFCEKLGIKFYTETAPVDTQKNETVAREQRYKFFENAMNKYNTDIVFTAHNYNDNAETLIYRIAKGTGLTGLKGILEKRGNYYRPLLSIQRKDIEKYCKDNGLEPNNDLSNNDTIHKRNLIRHKILPLLEEINPNVIKALNNLSKVTECELDILDSYINSIKNKVYSNGKIITKEFKKLDKNLAQKIIYEYIYNSEIDYDYRLIENATNFLINAINLDKISKFSLTKDRWLYVDKNTIEIIKSTKKNNEIINIINDGEYVYNDKIFCIKSIIEPLKISKDESNVLVDLSKYKKLTLRTRKDGDIIQPLGSSGKMKLKKYLMSKHIPQYKRDDLILLCDENEVLWVAGVGLSDKIKVKELSSHNLEIKNIQE